MCTPMIIIGGTIVIPVGLILIEAFTTWLAFRGTAGGKLNKCKRIIKKCDRSIKTLSKRNDDDSKKLLKEMEMVKERAVKEKDKYEKRVKELGISNANYRESNIFDNVHFV